MVDIREEYNFKDKYAVFNDDNDWDLGSHDETEITNFMSSIDMQPVYDKINEILGTNFTFESSFNKEDNRTTFHVDDTLYNGFMRTTIWGRIDINDIKSVNLSAALHSGVKIYEYDREYSTRDLELLGGTYFRGNWKFRELYKD